MQRRHLIQRGIATLAAPTVLSLPACGGGGGGSGQAAAPPPSAAATRTWKMGFAATPPRLDTATLIQGIDSWSKRAEIAAIHEEPPWADLLAGMTPDAILDRDKVQLVQYYRSKGLQLYVMGDINNGLDRTQEAIGLKAAGRSITEPAIQKLYRDYMLAVVRKLKPDYLGLAAETNLIRAAAPAALYAGVVQTTNALAADLKAAGATMPMLCSVQAETAWGVLTTNSAYVGIATDLKDFPFVQMWGISSYPYLAYTRPEDIPANYYSRLMTGVSTPAMVVEGGWTSAAVGTVQSSPDTQARYVAAHAKLLDSIQSKGLIQLLYADLDLSAWPQPIPPNLPLFGHIGLTDSSFAGKPALAQWDGLFARSRTGS